MLSSLLMPGNDSASISKLFATPTTPVLDVLDRADVFTYLRQFADPTKTPKSVLSFVERHMPKLLIAAQQKSTAVSQQSSAADTDSTREPAAGCSHGDAATNRADASVAVMGTSGQEVNGGVSCGSADDASAQADGSGGANGSSLLHGDGKVRGAGAGGAATASAVEKSKLDRADTISAGVSTAKEGSRAAVLTSQEAMMHSVNATELLYVYISSTDCSNTVIEQIVPVSLAALAGPGALNPTVALSVQRLLLAAFDNDFLKTTETIAMTLDEDLVRGTISNLSQSSVVAETVIALFGSALSASIMMAPTTHTQLFTSVWIELNFADVFCAHLEKSIRLRAHYNFFYFFRELLKRGFSHTAGPVVDELLTQKLFAPMLETTITTCEQDARMPVPSKASENSSLSAESMAVMSYVVGLLRKSLVIPMTQEMYETTTDYIAPLEAVKRQHRRLVQLLAFQNTSGAAIVRPNTVGLTRLSICELFVELILYQLSTTDTIVAESRFLPAFLKLCSAHSENDTLPRLLHKAVLGMFNRPLLTGETLSTAAQRDVLIRLVVDSEASAKRQEAENAPGVSALEHGAVLSALVQFGELESLRCTSLSTFSIDALEKLSTNMYFSKENDGPLAELLEPFRQSTSIRARLKAMQDPITGDSFETRGSARTPAPVHRPVVNLVGDRYRGKLSATSVTEGGSVGSPVWSAPVPPSPSFQASAKVMSPPVTPAVVTSTAEKHAAEDAVLIDIEALEMEVNELRAGGSPQLQAYPSFRSMHLGFTIVEEGSTEEGLTETAQVTCQTVVVSSDAMAEADERVAESADAEVCVSTPIDPPTGENEVLRPASPSAVVVCTPLTSELGGPDHVEAVESAAAGETAAEEILCNELKGPADDEDDESPRECRSRQSRDADGTASADTL